MITHAIITYSGAHYLLTADQEEALRPKSLDESIELEGSIIPVRSISEIMSIGKYYETFPNRKPIPMDRYRELPALGFDGVISISRAGAVKGIIKGLKNYIESDKYKGTEAPKKLLEMAEKRLAEIV